MRVRRNGTIKPQGTEYGDPLKWVYAHLNWKDKKKCLIWPFSTISAGYGTVYFEGKMQLVSRVICRLTKGPPPTFKHQAAHTYGKGHKGCANMNHLDWKTQIENEADKVRHGTVNQGERHGMAKLTEQDVRKIRSIDDLNIREIAQRFNVSYELIRGIRNGTRWKHITG